MRFKRLLLLCRQAQRLPRQTLVAACVTGALLGGLTLAQPQLDKTQQLAMERYGQRAADLVGAWRKLLEDSRNLPEAEKLAAANTFFNRRLLFEDDILVWKQKVY